MNIWLFCALALLLLMAPCGWLCFRGTIMERFVALQLAQLFAVLAILLLAEGYRRAIYFDLSLVLAVLSFASGLVYLRFLERWL
ncbi:monovalent cation/H+ antiporter complex subunit F [Geomonas ferrireducens]|uniref:monovalent cation/H+ antiporter complex subunit F n=1 Tax=Geomonas ferrireducens TaxID=2570227 RepID=UPI0013A5D349|nr:MrpF/PhaF family protein [Geomonas ferrireducens]